MIITCTNCNKKFKIDNSLIPKEGRDLQCGSCNHFWFFKEKDENNKILELKEEVVGKEAEIKVVNQEQNKIVEKNKKIIKEEKKEKIQEIQKHVASSKKIEKKGGNKFFSYLVVFFISFVALIIFLDTLKTPLINVFPGLEIILFNLFETLQDIKLFIIDLI